MKLLTTDHPHDVRVTGGFNAGKISGQLASQNNWSVALFLNHLLCCVDTALLPWKRFFFCTHPAQSFHHFTLWVTHIIVSHASDLLKNWHLAFSVIEADFLPYLSYSSPFVMGSLFKTLGTSHLIIACDIPSHAALHGRSKVYPPRPTSEARRNQHCQKTQGLIWGGELQYFQGGGGSTSFRWQHAWVAWLIRWFLPLVVRSLKCQNFA